MLSATFWPSQDNIPVTLAHSAFKKTRAELGHFLRPSSCSRLLVPASLPKPAPFPLPVPFADATSELWVALVEKAYAQINESGWIGQSSNNTYLGIAGGLGSNALTHITGVSHREVALDQNAVIADLAAGESIVMGTWSEESKVPITVQFVNSHAYALLGHNAGTGQFVFWNPWGFQVTASWNDVVQSMVSRSEVASVELPPDAEAFSEVTPASLQLDGVIARAFVETPGDAIQETTSLTASATVPVSFNETTNGGTSHGLHDTCFSKLDEIEFDMPIDAELLDVLAPAALS